MTERAPSGQGEPGNKSVPFDLGRRIPPALAIIGYLLLLIVLLRVRVHFVANHDVAWLTLTAERWLQGAVFGVDLMEINLPGAMLIYVPPVWLESVTGLRQTLCVDLWVGMMATLSAALTGRIVALSNGRTAWSRQAFLTGLLVAPGLLFLAGGDFGQRDQIVAILFLPYAILGTTIETGRKYPALRRLTAVLAALAICIKPHYVLLLVVGFLWQGRRLGFRQALRTSDALLIAVIGAFYIAVVIVGFGDWIGMMRSLSHLYLAYGSPMGAVLGAAIWHGLLICLGLLVANLNVAGRDVLRHLMIYAVATLVLFLFQGKGWEYHALLIKLFLWSGLAIVFVANLQHLGALSKYPAMVGLAVVLIPFMLGCAAWQEGMKDRFRYEQMVDGIGIRHVAAPGDAVLIISATMTLPFPLVTQEGYVWSSRYPVQWPLTGVVAQSAAAADLAGRQVLDDLVSDMIEDILRYKPKVIVIDDRTNQQYLPLDFHYLALLEKYPAFKAALLDYLPASESSTYITYVRRPD